MKRRIAAFPLCVLLLILLVLPMRASANSAAPDPVVTVKVKNAPAEGYTLWLTDAPEDQWLKGDALDSPAGEYQLHRFHVSNMPKDFSVVLSKADGTSVVSEVFHRQSYYATIVFDGETGHIIYATPVWLAYLIQFLCTCIPTLLIEGGLLVLLRFPWKKNWKLLLGVNLATQIFLTWCMASQFQNMGGRAYPWITMILAEIPIFLVEILIYRKWLKGRGAVGPGAYGFIANAASLTFGLFANSTIFSLLQRL